MLASASVPPSLYNKLENMLLVWSVDDWTKMGILFVLVFFKDPQKLFPGWFFKNLGAFILHWLQWLQWSSFRLSWILCFWNYWLNRLPSSFFCLTQILRKYPRSVETSDKTPAWGLGKSLKRLCKSIPIYSFSSASRLQTGSACRDRPTHLTYYI